MGQTPFREPGAVLEALPSPSLCSSSPGLLQFITGLGELFPAQVLAPLPPTVPALTERSLSFCPPTSNTQHVSAEKLPPCGQNRVRGSPGLLWAAAGGCAHSVSTHGGRPEPDLPLRVSSADAATSLLDESYCKSNTGPL